MVHKKVFTFATNLLTESDGKQTSYSGGRDSRLSKVFKLEEAQKKRSRFVDKCIVSER